MGGPFAGLGGFFTGGGEGNLMGGLGPSGLGLTGSESEATQTTNLDPITQALNYLRYNNLNNLQGDVGSIGQVLSPLASTRYLDPATQEMLNNAGNYANQGGMNPQDWYNQTLNQLHPGNASQILSDYYGGMDNQLQGLSNNALNMQNTGFNQNLNQSQNFYGGERGYLGNLFNSLNSGISNSTGNERDYLGRLYGDLGSNIYNNFSNERNYLGNQYSNIDSIIQNSLSPSLLGAGGEYYRQILGPQLGNQYSLMGLGRSGGRQEAEMKAAAGVGLPIAQQLASLRSQSALQGAQAQGALGQQLQSLLGALQSQYGGQQGSLSQQLLGIQGSLSGQQASTQNQLGLNQGSQQNQIFQNYLNQLSSLNQYFGGLRNQGYLQQGQGKTGIESQYLQNLFGMNQMYPQVDTNLRNAQLQRLQQGIGFSDYGRQALQGGSNQLANAYLSAFNSTPYTPAGSIEKTGTGNEGLLDTAFGAGVGQGIGGAVGNAAAKKLV